MACGRHRRRRSPSRCCASPRRHCCGSAIDLIAPDAVPFATYFPAILIATLIAGTAAGVVAALLGALAAWFIFVPPRFSMGHLHADDVVSLGLFFFAAFAIIWVADRYRAVVRRLDEEEAYRKIVVEELGHRVKNKLATVHAILRHELRGHRDVWESAAGRLRALMAADDFLVAGDGDGVDFRGILEMELAPYGSASVTIRGEPLMLYGKLPSVLSLIVHELATNAAKYGALSAPNGVIAIEWRERRRRHRRRLERKRRTGRHRAGQAQLRHQSDRAQSRRLQGHGAHRVRARRHRLPHALPARRRAEAELKFKKLRPT